MSGIESKTFTRIKWRIEDKIIAVKQKLPARFYRSPPDWLGYWFLLPSLILVGSIVIGLLFLLHDSFLQFSSLEGITDQYTTENWRSFFSSGSYMRVFLRTLGLSAVITLVSICLAFPYAYLTIRVRSAIVRKLLLISVFTPFFTGMVIRAYGWLIVLGENGLVNEFLALFGIGPFRILGTIPAVILGALQIMIPFAIMMIAPSIESIDRSVEQAAQNLGANRWETFRHVVMPLAFPGITGATIVVFTITTTLYAVPQILGLGRVNFMANVIYDTLFLVGNRPLAAVMAISLVVVNSLIVLVVFTKVGVGTLNVDLENTNE